jgi:ubiquinone/menaquinone biosynthesis C-methylase UbiE
MNSASTHTINEQIVTAAFTKQSFVFDEIYSPNIIVQYKRERVRNHVEQFLKPNNSILELNAGTGEDAIYFANKGYTVHATDISEGMQQQLINKRNIAGLSDKISTELCSFTHLSQLSNKGPFNHIFSNFAGLNCTNELDKVLQSFSTLLKPGGIITLVIMPRFCLWEVLTFFKGNFKNAFRRFRKNGSKAHIEGVNFLCWYYSPSYVKYILKEEFETLSVEGLCSIVPPSYFENFPVKYAWLYEQMKKLEDKLKNSFWCRNTGDYFIISLQKKEF